MGDYEEGKYRHFSEMHSSKAQRSQVLASYLEIVTLFHFLIVIGFLCFFFSLLKEDGQASYELFRYSKFSWMRFCVTPSHLGSESCIEWSSITFMCLFQPVGFALLGFYQCSAGVSIKMLVSSLAVCLGDLACLAVQKKKSNFPQKGQKCDPNDLAAWVSTVKAVNTLHQEFSFL